MFLRPYKGGLRFGCVFDGLRDAQGRVAASVAIGRRPFGARVGSESRPTHWQPGRLGEPTYPLAAEIGLADGVAFGEFAGWAGHGD